MAIADHTIDPRILDSAKKEFLAHGFEKASLKDICQGAGITTGALYKRYRGKEDLFCAVVADTVADMEAVVQEKCSIDLAALSDRELIYAWDMNVDYMLWWFRFLYQRRDGFVLLLRCAEGTVYSNFQHDWVDRMTGATRGYLDEARRRGLLAADISDDELHILLTAFWTTIYEPFIHDFTWQQIEAHCLLVCRLFNWFEVLQFSLRKD